MKTIKITSKKYGAYEVLVDDHIYDYLVTNFRWYISKDSVREYYYATGNKIGNSRKKLRMNRVVMGVTDPNIFVDHIDRNPLNNQKYNLRLATQSENQCNRPHRAISGFKGVRKNHGGVGYQIFLRKNRIIYCGGTYPCAVSAAFHYNAFSKKHHGEFAYQNPVTAIKYADGVMYTHEVKTPCSTPIMDKDFIIEQVRTFIHNRA